MQTNNFHASCFWDFPKSKSSNWKTEIVVLGSNAVYISVRDQELRDLKSRKKFSTKNFSPKVFKKEKKIFLFLRTVRAFFSANFELGAWKWNEWKYFFTKEEEDFIEIIMSRHVIIIKGQTSRKFYNAKTAAKTLRWQQKKVNLFTLRVFSSFKDSQTGEIGHIVWQKIRVLFIAWIFWFSILPWNKF